MRVSTKLAGALGLLSLIVVALLLHHVRALHDAVSTSYELSEISTRLALTSSHQAARLNQIEENAGKYWLTRDPGYHERFREGVAAFDSTLTGMRSLPLSEGERREIEALARAWSALLPQLLAFGNTPFTAAPLVDVIAPLRESVGEMRTLNRTVGEASQGVMTARLAESAAAAQRVERVSVVAVLLALLLSGSISALIVRSLARELQRLKEGTRAVAAGDFDYRLKVSRDDEFAELAHDFNAMTRRLGELERTKREFISKVSHDLKTPLASIQETIRILLDEVPGRLERKQRELLDLSQRSGERLSAMIGNILDLSGMEAGGLRPEIAPHLLTGIAESAVEQIAPLLRERGLAVRFDPDAPVCVPCDAGRTMQVLVNLLENAAKFSPAGASIDLTVDLVSERPNSVPSDHWARFVRGARGRDFALVEVADRGPGVDAGDRRRIFESFVQAEAGRRVRERGIGLGLAICREIVAAHGGAIGVADREGGGSVFFVLLPNAEAATPVAAASSATAFPGAHA